MKSFRRPRDITISPWLLSLNSVRPTYETTSSNPVRGFYEDRYRVHLGTGRDCFEAACNAIRTWKMFPSQMATLIPASVPIEKGTTLAVIFSAGPLWTVNPCRITDVVCESQAERESFGLAYSTLPGHIECGREEFLVELEHADNSVWYSIHVYSRPEWWPVWLVLPYARYQQRKFRRLSGEALTAAINEEQFDAHAESSHT